MVKEGVVFTVDTLHVIHHFSSSAHQNSAKNGINIAQEFM